MLGLLGRGDALATSCVNLAEVEAGLRKGERRKAEAVLGRLRFLVTTPEASYRAGRYQAEGARKGHTIETPDALVAGTARAHGAVLLTHNTGDFPMSDLRVEHPDHVEHD
jgi:predicted nucleic acid-binding protein